MVQIDDFLIEIILIIVGIALVFAGILAQNLLKRGPARNWSFIICLVAGAVLIVIGIIIIILRIILPYILPLIGL